MRWAGAATGASRSAAMGAAHCARGGRRPGGGGPARPALLEARLRRGRGSGKPSAPFGGGTVVSVTARDTDDTTVAPGENVRQTGGRQVACCTVRVADGGPHRGPSHG